MAENKQLKDFFNSDLIQAISGDVKRVWGDFNQESFEKDVLTNLEPLALKERAFLVADTLQVYLPDDYGEAVTILLDSFPDNSYNSHMPNLNSFYYMPHACFVERYGVHNYDESVRALFEITIRFTSEFPIRPFIERYPKEMMAQLHSWAEHENEHVRRLVSEGTRPRLPWASRLPEFQKDPEPVLELLQKLKEDKSLYVRRSVANNLNDIAKDHPYRVIDVLKKWNQTKNVDTKWLVKHAARTLVKQGYPKVLGLLGYSNDVKVDLKNLKIDQSVKIGGEVHFSFELLSRENEVKDLMIDYSMHFTKANGKLAAKVFKLSKSKIADNGTLSISKKHSFKLISTRKYYPGLHKVEVIVNGKSKGLINFELITDK